MAAGKQSSSTGLGAGETAAVGRGRGRVYGWSGGRCTAVGTGRWGIGRRYYTTYPSLHHQGDRAQRVSGSLPMRRVPRGAKQSQLGNSPPRRPRVALQGASLGRLRSALTIGLDDAPLEECGVVVHNVGIVAVHDLRAVGPGVRTRREFGAKRAGGVSAADRCDTSTSARRFQIGAHAQCNSTIAMAQWLYLGVV